MDGFGAGGAWRPLLEVLLGYLVLGCVVDLAVQWLAPVRVSRSLLVRGGAVMLAFAGLALASGQVPLATAIVIGGAAIWLASVRWRLTRPLAAVAAAWALFPALPPVGPGGPAPAPTGPVAEGPDIAIVVLDTVRKDRTSAYGHDRDTTPNLAALAEAGARFDRAWSTSCWSLPAHASLFTGQLPTDHGAHYEHLSLDGDRLLLAEILAGHGYQTAGFSANPLVAEGVGLARGFGVWEEPWREYTLREALTGWRIWHRFAAPDRDKGGADVVDGVRRWQAIRDPDRPALLFVNLMEAHAPYQEVPVEWRRAFTDPALTLPGLEAIGERSHMAQVLGTAVPEEDLATTLDLQDGAIAAADAYLGQIVEIVGQDTIWVVVSDHGELLGEHGLWGHNLGLWEPLVSVPMVVAGPGVPGGVVVDDPVSLVDVLPTVAAMAGADLPQPVAGVDLGPVVRGERSLAGRTLLAEHLRTDFLTSGWQLLDPTGDHTAIRARRAAARRGDLKRMVAEDGTDEGYDLSADPDEEAPQPGHLVSLAVRLPTPGDTTPVPALDQATTDALQALGYLR